MARLARLVVPGCPHHVTQRGNRRLDTFLRDGDYETYKALLADCADRAGIGIWAYCLMPNHVHLIMVPEHEDGLRAALAETHRRYSRGVNTREGWSGHLWQERFASFPMDDKHLLAAARYIELNPVRAGLVKQARAWPWSSAKAHLKGEDDDLVTVAPLLAVVDDWKAYLKGGPAADELETLRGHERTGRPLGSDKFITRLEKLAGRSLRKKKPGRPAKGTKKKPKRKPHNR